MDFTLLNNSDPTVVRKYVTEKFKRFNRFTYSKKTRIAKCDAYYIAAASGPHGQDIIEEVYQDVFKQLFDPEEARERIQKAKLKKPQVVKIESGEWLKGQEEHADDLFEILEKLKGAREQNRWQEGESFFSDLRLMVDSIDPQLCDQSQFNKEFSARCKSVITGSTKVTDKEMEAQFDLLVGFEQKAMCSFEARGAKWGLINAKLEESFKAGIWANGSAKAAMEKLGFSVEVQAAIAAGALLNVEGNVTWTKGKAGLKLSGELEAFAGARAEGSAKFSVNAREGLQASISAGAFAGLEFSASGKCGFYYDNQTLASVEASASITFGAGASFAASVKAPIFGPTEISFKGQFTLGIGTATDVKFEMDFSQMALASSEAFKMVVYWRTLAKGYEMTLMNSDSKNLYYLNKAISRLEDELGEVSGTIKSYNKIPVEKRGLLHSI